MPKTENDGLVEVQVWLRSPGRRDHLGHLEWRSDAEDGCTLYLGDCPGGVMATAKTPAAALLILLDAWRKIGKDARRRSGTAGVGGNGRGT